MEELSRSIMELVGDYVKKRGMGEPWDHDLVIGQVMVLETALEKTHREIGLLAESLEPLLRPIEGLHLVAPDGNERLVPWEVRARYTGPTPPRALPARMQHLVESAAVARDRVRSMKQRLELPPSTMKGE